MFNSNILPTSIPISRISEYPLGDNKCLKHPYFLLPASVSPLQPFYAWPSPLAADPLSWATVMFLLKWKPPKFPNNKTSKTSISSELSVISVTPNLGVFSWWSHRMWVVAKRLCKTIAGGFLLKTSMRRVEDLGLMFGRCFWEAPLKFLKSSNKTPEWNMFTMFWVSPLRQT